MKSIFRYITIAAALLATAVNAGAQYNYAGGVGTSKTVTQNDAESYTIRLETFATGSTTVTESSTPVDVVLVLDVSGSMNDNGKITKLKNAVNTFIETIQENDLYIVERDAQGNVTKKQGGWIRIIIQFHWGTKLASLNSLNPPIIVVSQDGSLVEQQQHRQLLGITSPRIPKAGVNTIIGIIIRTIVLLLVGMVEIILVIMPQKF